MNASGLDHSNLIYSALRREWASSEEIPRQLRPAIVSGAIAGTWFDRISTALMLSISRFPQEDSRQVALLTCCSLLRSDLSAIVRLCAIGLDVQARNILRGFIEKCDLACCVWLDAEFAFEFVDDSTFEGSRNFFHKRLSKGRLAKRVRRSVSESSPDHTGFCDWYFDEWRSDLALMLSAAEHPNHTVGFISLFPGLGSSKRGRLGWEGHPRNTSQKTIYSTLLGMFLFIQIMKSFDWEEIVGLDELGEDMKRWLKEFSSISKFIQSYPIVDSQMTSGVSGLHST